MSQKPYPRNPSLSHFKYQAKDLLKAAQAVEPEAGGRIREFHPQCAKLSDEQIKEKPFRLSDAQLVVAREYGFANWEKLATCTKTVRTYGLDAQGQVTKEGKAEDAFLRFVCLCYDTADQPTRREEARRIFAEHPELRGSSIHIAAATGDIGAATAILKRDGRLAREKGGPCRWEPLMYLTYSRFDSAEAWSKPAEVARLLLKHGADPNAGFLWDRCTYLFTALTGVFGEGEAGPVNQPRHPDEAVIARILLDAGADPNDGQTLYNRMFTKGASHLKLLLEYGLGKESKGPWQQWMGGKLQTPEELLYDQLFWACENDHPDRVELLLREKIDPDRANRNGRTAYELAMLKGNTFIADHLLASGATKKELSSAELLMAACTRGDRTQALELVTAHPGLLVDLGDHKVDFLVAAAGANRLDGVRLMIELGFPVNELKRTTALHEAAWNGHLEMAKLLVENGADPNIRDKAHNGRAVDWARHNQKMAVAEYLAGLTVDA